MPVRCFTVKRHQSGGTLVLGDPDRSLPNAATEAKAVAAIYGTTAWTGNDARESRLRRDSARSGIIHIEAHAHYDAGRPLFTTINLAPDEGDAGRDEEGDGHLHVYEVFDLDLSSIQLAVLSACETSIGPAAGGDDIVGLAHGFRYAGASSVLATLWAINDASSASFMTVFHRHVHDRVSAADALRQTQLQVIHQSESREPYYWAAYTLTR